MENKGLSILENLVSLVDTIASITSEVKSSNNQDDKINYNKNTNHKREKEEVKNRSNVIMNGTGNTNTVIHGNVYIKSMTINVNVNSEAYPKTSSQSEDYWVEQDKKYRESLGRFYRSNF